MMGMWSWLILDYRWKTSRTRRKVPSVGLRSTSPLNFLRKRSIIKPWIFGSLEFWSTRCWWDSPPTTMRTITIRNYSTKSNTSCPTSPAVSRKTPNPFWRAYFKRTPRNVWGIMGFRRSRNIHFLKIFHGKI